MSHDPLHYRIFAFTTADGRLHKNGVLRDVHHPNTCASDPGCIIHHPSQHHMRTWPIIWRADAPAERVCPHGIGHPDPDSLAHLARTLPDYIGIHGCDGCCEVEDTDP